VPGFEAWTALLRSAVATLGRPSRWSRSASTPRPRSTLPRTPSSSSRRRFRSRRRPRRAGSTCASHRVPSPRTRLDWQKALWDNDAAPYVDILPVSFPPGADVAKGVTVFATEAALHPPAARLRVHLVAEESDPWSAFRGGVAALASSASVRARRVSGRGAAAEAVAQVSARLQTRLASDYAPAPLGGLLLRRPEGGNLAMASCWAASSMRRTSPPSSCIRPNRRPIRTLRPVCLLDTIDVKDPASSISCRARRTRRARERPRERGPRAASALRLPSHGRDVGSRRGEPARARRRRGRCQVATTRGLTAEEIIARNRQVQKIQDDHLENWIAKARADYPLQARQAADRSTSGSRARTSGAAAGCSSGSRPATTSTATSSRGRRSPSSR
jgi:hypothetical protein